jgi:hypothetical protein
LNLYATSAVTTVAFDAARKVAGSEATPVDVAERDARNLLGRFESGGGQLRFRWDTSRLDVVTLDVVAERPSLLPNVRFPFQRVERTISVRREVPR